MRHFLIILISMIVGLNAVVYADNLGDITATYGGGSTYNDVEVSGSYAYVATSSGLKILDISTPDAPVQVSNYEMNAKQVVISGNYAYVVNDGYGTGFKIIDISNKSTPLLVVNYIGNYITVEDMIVEGNHAYIAAGYDGLIILDITTKNAPIVEGIYIDVPVYSLDIDGSFIYSSGAWSTILTVIDISDITAPSLAGSYDNTYERGTIGAVKVDASYVYLLDSSGLTIVDISIQDTPAFVANYNIGAQSSVNDDIDIVGNYAYVVMTSYNSDFVIVDISTKSDPQPAGNDLSDGAKAISISGEYAYISCNNSGFRIFDIQDKDNPEEVLHDGVNIRMYNIDVEGSYVYANSQPDGLTILDIEDKTNPVHVGPTAESTYNGRAGDIVMEGNYAYVISGVTLTILDITDKVKPLEISTYNITGESAFIMQMAIEGNFAYLAVSTGYAYSLIILDITTKTDPQPLGSYPIENGYPQVLEVSDDYVYIGIGSTMTIVDATDKENPEFSALYDQTSESSSIGDIEVKDNYAYIVEKYGYSNSLIVVDLSDKLNPQPTGNSVIGEGLAIEVSGNYAYIASSTGVKVMDILDKSNPAENANYAIGNGAINDFTLYGNYAYVSRGDGGLVIMKVRDEINIVPIITYLLF